MHKLSVKTDATCAICWLLNFQERDTIADWFYPKRELIQIRF